MWIELKFHGSSQAMYLVIGFLDQISEFFESNFHQLNPHLIFIFYSYCYPLQKLKITYILEHVKKIVQPFYILNDLSFKVEK